MTEIYPVIEQLLLMAVLILLGLYLNKTGKINQAAERGIAELTIDIAFPALIFTNIVKDFDLDMLRQYLIVPLSGLIITLISALLAYFISSLFTKSTAEKREFTFISIFSNNIFVGSPICLALFGSQGLILTILYDFGMQLVLWTLGIWLLRKETKADFTNPCKNIFSPPIIGLLLGLLVVFSGFKLPQVVVNISTNIGNITVPLAMIFIGLQLAKSNLGQVFSNYKVYYLALLRLLIIPAIVYFGLDFLAFPELLQGVMTIAAAMPVFASSPVIMQKYGHSSNFASIAIFATICFLIFTLPIFIYLVT